MNITEFIDMGGYGRFVWSSYIIWIIVMIINYVQPVMREKNTIKALLKRHNKNNL